MIYKTLSDFSCLCVTVEHPNGIIRKFRKMERFFGERKDVYDGYCNIMSDDYMLYQVPLDKISLDGKSKN